MTNKIIGWIKAFSKSQLLKRIKSLLWRGAMLALAFFIAWIIENLSALELSTTATTILGLVLGEVSKWVNNQIR